jgi:signal transduction histidine kinase
MNCEDDVPALLQQGVQRQASLMRALTRDLGQPLAQVRGTLRLLQQAFARGDVPSNTELIPLLDGLTACTDHVAATVTQLLDLALGEAGERPILVVHPVDLVALVRDAVWVHQATTSQQLLFQPPPDVLRIEADRDRLSRVVALLLANAQAYSPETSEIRIALSRQEDEGRPWAVLTVADHGLGIPATDLPHIFERFYRGANVADTTSGHGVGLSIALQTVEQHGGTIQVDRTERQGTTVTVWLPLD